MKKNSVRLVVLSALFAAIIFLLTTVVRVPLPFGYANIGDAAVLLAGWLLGPWYGAAAAAVGSALSDLIAFPMYAPVTAVIKALMAMLAAWIAKDATKPRFWRSALGGLLAEVVMVFGYFAFEVVCYGFGGAVVGIPFNSMQGGVCLVLACVCRPFLPRLSSALNR